MKRYQAALIENSYSNDDKFKPGRKSSMKGDRIGGGAAGIPGASGTQPTNYSSNMPPVASASMN